MPEVPVTYLCWGCGSETTVLEDISESGVVLIPSVEKWDLCPDCVEKTKKVEKDRGKNVKKPKQYEKGG